MLHNQTRRQAKKSQKRNQVLLDAAEQRKIDRLRNKNPNFLTKQERQILEKAGF